MSVPSADPSDVSHLMRIVIQISQSHTTVVGITKTHARGAEVVKFNEVGDKGSPF